MLASFLPLGFEQVLGNGTSFLQSRWEIEKKFARESPRALPLNPEALSSSEIPKADADFQLWRPLEPWGVFLFKRTQKTLPQAAVEWGLLVYSPGPFRSFFLEDGRAGPIFVDFTSFMTSLAPLELSLLEALASSTETASRNPSPCSEQRLCSIF